MSQKVGRNDKCPCLSGKKFKTCCLIKVEDEDREKKEQEIMNLLTNTQESNERLKTVMERFKTHFGDEYTLIDISPYINAENYRQYQLKFFNKKTIMFIDRTDENESVFNHRVPNRSANLAEQQMMMILYNGQYRTFEYKMLDRVIDSLYDITIIK